MSIEATDIETMDIEIMDIEPVSTEVRGKGMTEIGMDQEVVKNGVTIHIVNRID